MKTTDLAKLRLQIQHLSSPAFSNPADLVEYMGAVQAQDYTGAKWAVGQRLIAGTDQLIEKAFTNGDIIRTHVMRPTWHFVSPKDIRWMLELTAPRVQALAAFQQRQFKLDTGVFSKCEKALIKALSGGKQLMRNEVAEALKNSGIDTDEQRFIHIMMQMELIGLVCSGGRKGKQFTYALLDERVPATKNMERDEALAALAERYFNSHGPATLKDYVWWSGLTVTDAKIGLEIVKDKLTNLEFDRNIYWYSESTSDSKSKSASCLLLPNYDEYIVGYKDRSAAIKSTDINKTDPRGTIFNNTVLINGQIIGIWKHNFKSDRIGLEITRFKPLSKVNEAAVRSASKRYAKFLGFKKFEIA